MDTRTAQIELRPNGVIWVRVHDGAVQTLTDAQENIRVAVELAVGSRRPILVDIRRTARLEAEARHHYSGTLLVDSFAALGLLIEVSALGRLMGNAYLRVAQPGIPTKLFTDEAAASAWLEGHVA